MLALVLSLILGSTVLPANCKHSVGGTSSIPPVTASTRVLLYQPSHSQSPIRRSNFLYSIGRMVDVVGIKSIPVQTLIRLHEDFGTMASEGPSDWHIRCRLQAANKSTIDTPRN